MEAIAVLGRNVMVDRGLSGLTIDSLAHCRPGVREVFDMLDNDVKFPALLHCTQGKDRTGIVVLLALLLCWVDHVASRPITIEARASCFLNERRNWPKFAAWASQTRLPIVRMAGWGGCVERSKVLW